MIKNDEYKNSFLQFLKIERNLAENTILSYDFDISGFLKYIHSVSKNLEDILYFDIIAFFKMEWEEKNIEPSSQLRKISSLYNFYKFLINEKGFTYNPLEEATRPSLNERLPIFINKDDSQKLLLTAEQNRSKAGIRNYAILCILHSSGMRISECLNIKMQDIFDYKGKIKKIITITGKGEKERIIFFNQKAKDSLLEYLEIRDSFIKNKKNDFVFCADTKNLHFSRQSFFYALKKICYFAKIDESDISPHKIRHSFATNLFLNGIDLRILQEMLGHADISTTQIYTHINTSAIRETLEKNHPLNKIKPKL